MERSAHVFEPQAVHVFARLAAISETRARRLVAEAAEHHGSGVSVSGNVSAEERETFARVWDRATSRLRRAS